jgi:hypothetical protein
MEIQVMRSLLYLAYFFPPRGGAAVQRSLKFAKYLPEFGWRPVVIANGGGKHDNVTKVQDPTMLKELPGDAVVRYTVLNDAEEKRYQRSLSKFRQRMNVTDSMNWWIEPAMRLGMEMVEAYQPGAIVVTMSPFTSWRAGFELKRRTGLPLVFDLRDPWALDETRIYPTRWHAWRDRVAMARALAAADLVVMNTPESTSAVRKRFDIRGKVITITNGYDAADFGNGGMTRAAPDVLRIVHTGMFHSELAEVWDHLHGGKNLLSKLKYARRPINLWTRTPRYLLEAMYQAIKSGQIPKDKIELVLVGELSEHDREMVEGSPVAECVKLLGYQSHDKSVAWLESADALFLPLHTPLDGGRPLIVPGKAYECLGSGRPILAMGPEGDMCDFVAETGSGKVIRGDDVAAAARALVELYRGKLQGKAPMEQDRAGVEQFERRQLTRMLAEALDELVGVNHRGSAVAV